MNEKSFVTALAIVPPEAAWAQIDAIRAKHDKAYGRWMPHINLLFPFVPESQFDAAASLLRDAVRGSACTVELTHFKAFPHGNVHIEPRVSPVGALQRLYDKIAAVFPLLVVRPEFHPHMTVGQWPKRELAATCSKLAAAWAAVRFECVDVVLLARRGNEPFRIVKRVSLAATDAAPAAAPAAAAAAAAAAASSTAVQPSAWSDMRGSIDPATSGFAESLSNALAEAAEEEAARRDPGLLFVTPPDSLPLSCHPTFERVRDWVIRSDANQLPKTRARLVQAMRPFLKATVDVDAAEMLALMQSEGYVEIKGEKQPVELPKKIADSKKQPLVPHAMLADANADIAAAQALAKSRCIAHLSAAGTKHRTQASLMASLKMLCRLQKPVDPQLIVDALIAAGLLEFVDPPPPNYARSQTRAPRHRDDEKRIHYF